MTIEQHTVEECDHDWEVVDDSFSHEFGTQVVVYQRCLICDAVSDYDPPDFDGY
jgi:hypothetical protein